MSDIKLLHSDSSCHINHRFGQYSSAVCWGPTSCPCSCHKNGLQALLTLLMKLDIKSANQLGNSPWLYVADTGDLGDRHD